MGAAEFIAAKHAVLAYVWANAGWAYALIAAVVIWNAAVWPALVRWAERR